MVGAPARRGNRRSVPRIEACDPHIVSHLDGFAVQSEP